MTHDATTDTAERPAAAHPARQVAFTALDTVEVVDAESATPPGPHEVSLSTSYVGICGSDIAALTGRHPWFTPPLSTGHEVTGRVRAAGPDVTGLAVGDAVLLNPLVSCGECLRCRQGSVNQCESAAVRGYRVPGAAVTRLVVPAAELHRLPPELEPAEATLAEPLAAAWRAATRWDDLDSVAVIGAGSIGQLVLSSLLHRGARDVLVVEPDSRKRELALARGASVALHPDDAPGDPCRTAVFDCVGGQHTLDWATGATLGGGAVVMVGVPDTPRTVDLPRTQRFEIALLGSGLYTPSDVDTAIRLIAGRHIDVRPLISGVYPLERAPEAYRHARDPGTVKILVDMTT